MTDYILSCSSSADLTLEHLNNRDIKCLYFGFSIGGKEYKDDLGKSVPYGEFYRRMAEGEETKTWQTNAEGYAEYFRGFLKEGKDVVHVALSSGLTGTYNSAKLAVEMLKEEFPQRNIYVVDSLGACGGFGLLVDYMADMRDSGMTAKELADWAESNRLKVNHWFFSTDLSYYIRGGRIGKLSGWFGTALKICPLLDMDNLGRLIPRYKIRGKSHVIIETEKKMEELAENGTAYDGKCFINHADAEEDAKALAELIEQNFPNLKGKIVMNSIGTIIGSHTGPGTVALFFMGKERVD